MEITEQFATGRHCTNYRAETYALIQSASIVQSSTDPCQQVVSLTDALSVLQALESNKLHQLTQALQQVSRTRRVVLQWIPAHCGIPGNEKADTLAKRGAQEDQPDNSVIRSQFKPRSERDDNHRLSQEQQVILMRLRTGHNRLNAHMNHKFKLAPSPTCPCGLEDQTAEHILQRCPLLQEERREMWPAETLLKTKLHGGWQKLEKTTAFIIRCGLSV